MLQLLTRTSVPLSFSTIVTHNNLLGPAPNKICTVGRRVGRSLLGTQVRRTYGLNTLVTSRVTQRYRYPTCVTSPRIMSRLRPTTHLAKVPRVRHVSVFRTLGDGTMSHGCTTSVKGRCRRLGLVIIRLKNNVSINTRYGKQIVSIGGTLGNRKPFSPRHTKAVPTSRLTRLYFDNGCALGRVGGVLGNGKKLATRLNVGSIIAVTQGTSRNRRPCGKMLSTVLCAITGRTKTVCIALHKRISTVVLAKNVTRDSCYMKVLGRRVSCLTPIILVPNRSRVNSLTCGTLKTLGNRLPLRICQPRWRSNNASRLGWTVGLFGSFVRKWYISVRGSVVGRSLWVPSW